MKRFVLALDQGTTGTTALVVDADGRIRARGYAELPQHFPRPGWVEHDPDEIWASVEQAARAALAAARVGGGELAAIGITNQRETTVLWDRATGRPIHRAIVWQCRRTAPLCERLRADGLEAEIRTVTGLVLDAYFSGTKIRWLLDEVPGARARAEDGRLCFGTVDAWLIWRLTGGAAHVTDPSNASRTLCLDLRTGEWSDAMLRALGIPRAIMPAIGPSAGPLGETVDLDWVPAGVPIAGVAGDQQAALFGQACHAPGTAKNTWGTGAFLLLNTGGAAPVASPGGLLGTIAWRIGGRLTYALEGAIFVAGAVVQWLRDGLGIIREAAETEALARSVPDTGGVYLVPAFVGLGAPHWDMYARGAIVGLTRGTTRAHLARAALESIAYQTRDVLDVMTAEAGLRVDALRVDGGAAANDVLCQYQADVLGLPVVRPRVIETTGLGAAWLAGLGAGLWRSQDAIAARAEVDRTFEPALDAATRAERYEGWKRAVERAKGWAAAG